MTPGSTLSTARRAGEPPPGEGSGFSTSTAGVARMCNYFLGGKDNYAADRDSAERVLRRCPIVLRLVQANRGFLDRAATLLAGTAGLRQFVDIGCGLPADDNLGDIVRRTDPSCRVAYVDNDPMVLAHARALLAVDASTGAFAGDVRDPEALLAGEGLRKLIDFGEPAAVFLLGVLDFLPDEAGPRGIVDALAAGLAPGSHVVVTHAERSAELAPIAGPRPGVDTPFHPRAEDEIGDICRSLEMIEPYPARLPQPPAAANASGPLPLFGCIGRVPG
ncbi:SAM-dependent methyltransferase [Actinomadura madurae]|uniref:SAM-dependent methyltransferase n=1 Tax=Actinomadura madurae TaxID=1993 RepID=UPI002027568F|nr:SAM-dependent methyltransferase [Actinomadura madurae]MCP9949908.1 SAM-dependent methyltransferase [Actinomadura madurae]MCQ0009319.1 SAM-dependent methyltransferase [Actinomadura madurae]URM95483.1 SAM-dependent methyltransferase [Actinomadura madurae]